MYRLIVSILIPTCIYCKIVSKLQLQDCNSFKAGDNIRSKQKNKKLDEKGVFGSVCRHEIPLLFLNLPEGERLVKSKILCQVKA